MNKRMPLSRPEKFCFAGIVFLAVLIIAILIWWRSPQKAEPSSPESKTGTLAVPEDKLPQNLELGHAPPVTDFTDANGKTVSLSSLRGRPAVLLFWASWCKYCREQLSGAKKIEEIAEHNGAQVLLIDKLDSQKETQSKALSELSSLGVSFPNWFDRGLSAYKAWGIQEIPTAVVLNSQGNVAAYASGLLTAGDCEGLMEYALRGGDAATAAFISKNMTNQGGGVYCNAKDSGSTPGGHDVLSETQGLMMQYAVLLKNKSLFDSAWKFTKEKMEKDGLAAWYVTSAGKTAGANAALDDLRIWAALADADSAWDGYRQAADSVRGAVYRDCVQNSRLVSFYDFQSDKKSHSLPLCYADISVLRRMAEEDTRFRSVAENALKTVQAGYISDQFPLYRSSYDYDGKSYSSDDLNMSEALYTLWNLAKAGELKPQSLAWLKKQVSGEGLAARYHVDGSVVAGYDYHSTAVYALAALIAEEEGDRGLYNAAIQKMERYRSSDAELGAYGAFGDSKTGDYPAFDQCMPLLVYAGKCP